VYQVTPTVERQRLAQAMRWTPDNPWYWRRLAALETPAADMGQAGDRTTEDARQLTVEPLQRAAAAYEQALQKQPTDPYTQLDGLHVKLRLMRLQPPSPPPSLAQLETLYRRLASLAPAHAKVQYALGVAILTAETEGIATPSPRPFLRRAIELDANYLPQILEVYRRLLPAREARKTFAGTLPNTAKAHQQAARILERSHWPQAHLHYQTALILSQSAPEILQAYAEALMRRQALTRHVTCGSVSRRRPPMRPRLTSGSPLSCAISKTPRAWCERYNNSWHVSLTMHPIRVNWRRPMSSRSVCGKPKSPGKQQSIYNHTRCRVILVWRICMNLKTCLTKRFK
jgi:tetratricopeptide (TPR) repeat protein